MKHKIEDEKIPMSLLRVAEKCGVTLKELIEAIEFDGDMVSKAGEAIKELLKRLKKMNVEREMRK